MKEPEISDWNYILSSLGNAYFSGLSFQELWQSVELSETREELDASVTALSNLKDLLSGHNHSR